MKSSRVLLCWVGAAWLLLVLGVMVRYARHPERTIQAYQAASLAWLAGQPLYDGSNEGFLYAPQAAVLYLPFALLPTFWGGLVWRLVNLAVLVWGIRRFTQLLERPGEPNRVFALVSVFAVPLAYGSAANGQFNLVMAGLMLAAMAALVAEQWWRTAVLLLLAVAVKPLSAVLLLLVLPLYPVLIGRCLVVLPAVVLFPFLAQSPAYVLAQYREFATGLPGMSSFGDVRLYSHIFSTLTLFGLDVPHLLRNAVRVGVAGLTLLACYRATRSLPRDEAAFYLYALACAYVLVFNPRSEGVTYSILGPALGIWVVLHQRQETRTRRPTVPYLAGMMLFVLVVNYAVSKALYPDLPPVIFTPIVGATFLLAVLAEALLRSLPLPPLVQPSFRTAHAASL